MHENSDKIVSYQIYCLRTKQFCQCIGKDVIRSLGYKILTLSVLVYIFS